MPGATVIDVGTTIVDGVLNGDVDFESAVEVAGRDHAGSRRRRSRYERRAVAKRRQSGRARRSVVAERPSELGDFGARRAARLRCIASAAASAFDRARATLRRRDGVPIVSRVTGRLLSTIVTAMQANRILEVGTGYGYSTLWMALAQPPRRANLDDRSRCVAAPTSRARTFRRAGEDDYIEVFNTPALELLENFPHRNLDVVFVAANESEYLAYLDLVFPMLKLSGLAIFNDCLADAWLRATAS